MLKLRILFYVAVWGLICTVAVFFTAVVLLLVVDVPRHVMKAWHVITSFLGV